MKVNISVLRAFNWWEVIFQRFYSIWGAGAELKAQSACSTLQLYGQRCRSTRLQSSYREYFLARRIDFLDFLCWHHHKYILLLFLKLSKMVQTVKETDMTLLTPAVASPDSGTVRQHCTSLIHQHLLLPLKTSLEICFLNRLNTEVKPAEIKKKFK